MKLPAELNKTLSITDRFRVGQNIYMTLSTSNLTATNWTAAVRAWYDEVVNMNYGLVKKFR